MKKLLIVILLLSFIGCEAAWCTMTSTIARESLFTGDGTTTAFAFTFPIVNTSDLEVWLRTTATGAQSQQTETTHFSVSATNNNFTTGGTVTMVTAPTSAQKLLILRATPQTQLTDFGSSGVHLAIENSDDKMTRQIIDLQEAVTRCLKFPKTDATTLTSIMDDSITRASQRLGFNSSGEPAIFDSGIDAGDVTVPDYFTTVIEGSTSEVAFKILVNAQAGVDFQAWDTQLDDIAALAVTDGFFIVADGANWTTEATATARASLGLIIGTDVQAFDAGLDSIANITYVADEMIYFSASNTAASTTVTSFIRTLLDDADAAAARTTLGAASSIDEEGIIKAWVNFDGDDGSIRDSFNVTSVSRDGAGLYTITWDTDFADANYSVTGMTGDTGTIGHVVFGSDTPLSGATASIKTIVSGSAGGAAADFNIVTVIAIGDQ